MPKDNKQHKSKIGGQALIEGIMMRGIAMSAMAVRLPNGSIDVETWETEKKDDKCKTFKKIPFLRGIFQMIDSLIIGYRCLMKSAEKAGMDEEAESGFDRWMEKKFGDQMGKVIGIVGGILGMLLAVGLFLFFPSLIVWAINLVLPLGVFASTVEGLIKIGLFIGYLAVISNMKDIRRTFEYHGAEHKTIACFEAGLPLTVENTKQQPRLHPRCGTSFLFLVLFIGILIFSVVSFSNPILRTLIKFALMPVVIGIAYELIRLAGRHDNAFTRLISFPGLQLQKLTTREPDDSQLEVAIEAIKPTLPERLEDDQW